MNSYSEMFPIAVFLSAYSTANLLAKNLCIPLAKDSQSTFDGLRGTLALAVFKCHTTAWHLLQHLFCPTGYSVFFLKFTRGKHNGQA